MQERDDFGQESGPESHTYEFNDVVCPNADCKGAELEADLEQGHYVCTNCGYIPAQQDIYEDDVIQSLRGQQKQEAIAAFFGQHPESKNSALQTSSSVARGLGAAQKQANNIQKQLTEAFRESISRRIELILRDLVKRMEMPAAVVTEAHTLALQFIRPLDAQRLQKRMTVIETKDAELSLIMCCRACWKDVASGAYRLDCGCTLCDKCKPVEVPELDKEMSWEEIIKSPRPPPPPEHSCRSKQAFNKTKETHRATSRPTVTAFSAIAAACVVLVGERRGVSPRSQAICAAISHKQKKSLRKDNLRSWVRRIRAALVLQEEPSLTNKIAAMANWYAVGCTPTERSDNALLAWYLLHPQRPRPPWLKQLNRSPTVEDVDGRLTTVLLYLRRHHHGMEGAVVPVKHDKSAWMIAAVVAYLRMRLRAGAGEDIDRFTARIGVTTARFQACKAELVQLI